MDVGADKFAEFDGVRHGFFVDGSGGDIGVDEGVEDEGDATDVGGEFVVEAANGFRGVGGAIDVVVEPGGPGEGGFGRALDDGVIRDVDQQAHEDGDVIDVWWVDVDFAPVGLLVDAVDGEEAFEEAIFIAGAKSVEEARLEAADDGDDGGGDPEIGFTATDSGDGFG